MCADRVRPERVRGPPPRRRRPAGGGHRDGDGVYLLDRTSDASHNRSVFTMAGEHARSAGPRAARRGRDPRDRHGRAHRASTRASGRSTSSRSSRSATTTMDDCIELARAFGERIADRFELPVYLYAEAATRPDRGQAGRRPPRRLRGPAREIGQRGREPGLRPGPDASVGGRRGGRGAAVPDRLQHQPRHRATSSSPSGSRGGSANPAAACRRSRPTASGSSELDAAQVSMNLLDFAVDAALAGVGHRARRSPRRTASSSRESELIGLAPQAAFAGRRGSRGRAAPTDRSSAASRPPPRTCGCATSRRCRPSSCDSTRPRRVDPTARRPRRG